MFPGASSSSSSSSDVCVVAPRVGKRPPAHHKCDFCRKVFYTKKGLASHGVSACGILHSQTSRELRERADELQASGSYTVNELSVLVRQLAEEVAWLRGRQRYVEGVLGRQLSDVEWMNARVACKVEFGVWMRALTDACALSPPPTSSSVHLDVVVEEGLSQGVISLLRGGLKLTGGDRPPLQQFPRKTSIYVYEDRVASDGVQASPASWQEFSRSSFAVFVDGVVRRLVGALCEWESRHRAKILVDEGFANRHFLLTQRLMRGTAESVMGDVRRWIVSYNDSTS